MAVYELGLFCHRKYNLLKGKMSRIKSNKKEILFLFFCNGPGIVKNILWLGKHN